MIVERAQVNIRGAVQGVGFRPFVYRLAREFALSGWVCNTGQGLLLEVEGPRDGLEQFLCRLRKEKPANAIVQSVESSFLQPVGYAGFEVRHSISEGGKQALVLPDLATCQDCLRDVFEPGNRRYLYPFTNCSHCGPRFSIIEALPYDRANTSMKKFQMCPECEREYLNPASRRFHAQPNACPWCGPTLKLWGPNGEQLAVAQQALLQGLQSLRTGQILAVKSLGGFQLMTDARNQEAVLRLRARKRRPDKPFAVMYPDLDALRRHCYVSSREAKLLRSPAAPIVLLDRCVPTWRKTLLAPAVAPANPLLGVILPYTALHHLLLRELRFPIVATSGNLSDEPICIDENEALERFRGIADIFLVHDRPVVRHVDDSVARIFLGREQILRRARGYAPLPVRSRQSLPSLLAVGSHLKNTVALSAGHNIFISQHIGDLETGLAYAAFRKAAVDLPSLYEVSPQGVACDLHPDYLSTAYANALSVHRHPVQHHWAHVAACMLENGLEPPVLGVAWDGTGLGTDGVIWGGEFLRAGCETFERFAHLRPFRLPGASAAVRQPRRSALGLLLEIMNLEELRASRSPILEQFSASEVEVIQRMLQSSLNSPFTTSAGRLFDAVASLLGLRQRTTFEGQAAMELEFRVQQGVSEAYSFGIHRRAPLVVDWEPMMRQMLHDLAAGENSGVIAAKFHHSLAEIIGAVAEAAGEASVVLTGGCFQNKYLAERTIQRLRKAGFRVYWHQQVPPNDGGIALGQIAAAAWAMGSAPREMTLSPGRRHGQQPETCNH